MDNKQSHGEPVARTRITDEVLENIHLALVAWKTPREVNPDEIMKSLRQLRDSAKELLHAKHEDGKVDGWMGCFEVLPGDIDRPVESAGVVDNLSLKNKIAIAMGFPSWAEFAEACKQPNELLADLPWKEGGGGYKVTTPLPGAKP